MPNPINPEYSIDKYFYKASEPLSNYISFIHPNVISSCNFILSFIITYMSYYNYIWNGYFIISLIIMLIRTYLDILDGAHARNLKKTSEVGAFLDALNDLLFMIVNCFLYSTKIPEKFILFKIFFFLLSFILIVRLLVLINKNNFNLLDDVPNIFKWITKIIHDNTIICNSIIFFIIDYTVYFIINF